MEGFIMDGMDGLNYGGENQSFIDLETNEVATKAMRDEMLSVDRYGNIIDLSKNQQPPKKSLFQRIFKKK